MGFISQYGIESDPSERHAETLSAQLCFKAIFCRMFAFAGRGLEALFLVQTILTHQA